MERLTKRVGVGEAVPKADFNICAPFIRCGCCKTGMQGGFPRRWERHCNDTCILGTIIDRLAHYEDLEEQGRLVELPCKVGDTIYEPYLGRILERQVVCIVIQSSFMVIYCGGSSTCFSSADFGKTVFLTREEANRALKGGSK